MAPKKTTKKTTKKVAKAVETKVEQVDELDLVLRMTEVEALKIKNLMLEVQLARLKVEVAHRDRTDFIKKIDPENLLERHNQNIGEKSAEAGNAMGAYQDFLDVVGQRLNVNIREFSFDDETGVLIPLE